MLNRKFVQTDDAMKDFEGTSTAVNVSQTSHSLLIYESKSKRMWLEGC